MKTAIDIRSLTDGRARGVFSYGRPIVDALVAAHPDTITLFSTGTQVPPFEAAPVRHLRVPNKLVNAAMRFLGTPTIDGVTGCRSVWMPNLNYWSVGPRCALTVTVHDLSFLVEPEWFSPRERLWHRAIGARALIKRADAIITLSGHTKRELVERLEIPEERIHVIVPGVPMTNDGAAIERLRADDGRSESGVRGQSIVSHPYILYIGALERRKNVVRAIESFECAAERLPEMHFVIAGTPGAGFGDIALKAQASRFNKRIHLIENISTEQKASLLTHATAFFFPSLYEGFGFPPLEAMTAGVPVVASSAGALPETLGNAAILLDPIDTGAFADALVAVCTDEALRSTLIARGEERVKQFSWERAAQETFNVIHGV